MSVSTRNILVAGLAASAFITVGGTALAGGMGAAPAPGGCAVNCGTGPVAPPTPTGRPQTGGYGLVFPGNPGVLVPGAGVGGGGLSGGGTGPGCCGGRPTSLNVVVPGVTLSGPQISVGGPRLTLDPGAIVTNGGFAAPSNDIITKSFLAQQQRQQTFLGGGGGSGFAPEPGPTSQISLPGGTERYTDTVTEQVPVTEQFCAASSAQISSVRPVQAVCLDDKGTPHPASRVDDSARVPGSYSGELFRCVAGTAMQVTLGTYDGKTSRFDRAETFSCAKGEALVHAPGGTLTCAVQAPQRNCNERSLLRRHGPGVKLVEMKSTSQACVPQTRTTYQSVARQVERVRQLPSKPMNLTGGVGNGVN
jgi:hypothetical protein